MGLSYEVPVNDKLQISISKNRSKVKVSGFAKIGLKPSFIHTLGSFFNFIFARFHLKTDSKKGQVLWQVFGKGQIFRQSFMKL